MPTDLIEQIEKSNENDIEINQFPNNQIQFGNWKKIATLNINDGIARKNQE